MWHVRDTRVSSCVSLEDGRAPGKEEKGRPAVTQDQHTQQDPTTQYPQPEFGEQQLEHPGLESEMRPKPDYGGDTYRGSGQLEGKGTLLTGGGTVLGRARGLPLSGEGAPRLIHLPVTPDPVGPEAVPVCEGSTQ